MSKKHVSEPSTRRIDCDVVVIGGGFAGVFATRALAERGVSCVLIERDSIGGGDGASCSFHALFRGTVPDVAMLAHELGIERVRSLDALANASAARLRAAVSDTNLVQSSTARRVMSGEGENVASLRSLESEVLRALGIEHAEVATDELQTFDDLALDGAKVLALLRTRFDQQQVTLLERENVTVVESDVESVIAHTASSTVHATRAVLATGAWSLELDTWLRECSAIGRAHEFMLDCAPGTRSPNRELLALGPFVTAIPIDGDRMAIVEGRSPGNRGEPFDVSSDPAVVERCLRSLGTRIAHSGTTLSARARPRLYTCDGMPIVGPHPLRGSILLATGFNGLDATFAPIAGEIVADWITEGRPSRREALLWSPRRML